MKSLVEKINEALGDVTPKQFIDIWKGKNVSIDAETMNNAAYFSNELCSVHRSKLPTPEEFTNVCEWIIDNTSWSKEDAEKFLTKVMETYLQTNNIDTSSEIIKFGPGDIRFIKTSKGINFFDDNFKLIAATMLFFNMNYTISKSHPDLLNKFKEVIDEMFKPAFNKYNVFWDNWPDYSEGFNMLVKHFN